SLTYAECLLARSQKGRRVNSIFGEGVNPRMRKIRDALDLVGLPADQILRHANSRVVYGIALANNFSDVLLGRADKPQYLLPQTQPTKRSELICDYWRKRWLSNRVKNP